MRRGALIGAVAGIAGGVLIIGVVAASAAQRVESHSGDASGESVVSATSTRELEVRRLAPPESASTPVDLASPQAAAPAEVPAPEASAPEAVIDESTDAGTQPGGDVPIESDDEWMPTPEEQQTWLAFQQTVRDCMAAQGQEYLYWEWWSGTTAMPAGLSPEARAAWDFALYGDDPGGPEYRWQDAGCWGAAAEAAGNTH